MKRVNWLSKTALATILLSPLSIASDYSDKQVWQSWPLVGEAQLSFLFFDVYRSKLLTPSGQYIQSADITPHPLALSIDYQRDISKKELLDATKEQWIDQGYKQADVAEWIAQLSEIFPSVKRGENLTYVTDGQSGHFIYSPQASSMQFLGGVENEKLNDAFVGIWLSPKTEFSDLRAQLIGKN